MALVLGASHVCTGTGSVAISRPLGLRAVLTGIPSSAAAEPGTPLIYHQFRDVGIGQRDRSLGRISLGVSSLGFAAAVDLVNTPQLVYPLADEFDLLGWTLKPGVTATIDEIVRPAVANSALQPWDRAPGQFRQFANTAPGAPSTIATAWTYTVPAGRRLMLSQASVEALRTIAATTVVQAVGSITVAGSSVVSTTIQTNVVGERIINQLSAGPLFAGPGEVITATSFNSDTNGQVVFWLRASGVLFDA